MSIQESYEASGPFLVPRVTETFNHFAIFSLFHDFITTQQEEGRGSRGHLPHDGNHHPSGDDQQPLDGKPGGQCEDAKVVEEIGKMEGEGTLGEFKLCMPETRLEQRLVEDHKSIPSFRKTLKRHDTFLVERYVLLRPVAIIVGAEGPSRFIRPWCHEHWCREIRKHGFVTPDTFPLVASQVYFMMQGLPECATVARTRNGFALAFCGKGAVQATIWTAESTL